MRSSRRTPRTRRSVVSLSAALWIGLFALGILIGFLLGLSIIGILISAFGLSAVVFWKTIQRITGWSITHAHQQGEAFAAHEQPRARRLIGTIALSILFLIFAGILVLKRDSLGWSMLAVAFSMGVLCAYTTWQWVPLGSRWRIAGFAVAGWLVAISADCFVNASDKTLLDDGVATALQPVHAKLDRNYAATLRAEEAALRTEEAILRTEEKVDFIAEEQKKQATKDDLAATIAPVLTRNTDLEIRNSKLAATLQVTESALRTFFVILDREGVSQEKWPETLAQIAVRHRDLLADLRAADATDATQAEQKQQALAAIEEGDYDLAETLLTLLSDADLAAARQHQDAANARYRKAAESTALLADFAMTRIDYRSAAGGYKTAADLVRPFDDDACTTYLWRHADALYMRGLEGGDNDALASAIEAWKDLVIRQPRERVPLDWAATQNKLGVALWTLGGRERGTERLEEAITAYRAALEEHTRQRVPLDWAMTQTNLGNALQTLGGRESGSVSGFRILGPGRRINDGPVAGFLLVR